MRLSRRDALARIASATTLAAVAGCTGDTGGATTDDPTPTDASTTRAPTTAATATATGTETPPQTSNGTATATPTGDMTDTGTPARGDYSVGMYTDLYFDPVGLHVEPGETVSFVVEGGAHSATAYHPDNENALERRIPDGAPAWDTGVWGDVGTFRNVTFDVEGTHDYYCIPHKMVGMVGRIVVGSPGGPAEESENPDLKLPDSGRIVERGSVTWDEWKDEV